ncbi:EAL domain-containing protein [Parasphingopyxis algicola]|uniref:sensor domain-containing phosphodiesterase n=1 Tax=Parasphingopyxis algicola TaxID=2026624 RepID=UPI0015A40713|nr:EAL domain-containing protein [Parasphingopyxis algicola]QLC25869.1 EAL domain-containing protein [Parasphingopyxis algicola]
MSDHEDTGGSDRYASLRDYEALQNPSGSRFDPILELVCGLIGVPRATIWLAETERHLFERATVEALGGPAPSEQLRSELVNAEPEGFEIHDFAKDPQSAALVQPGDAPEPSYYIGFALRSRDDRFVGVLSAMDTRPRAPLDQQRRAQLRSIADIVVDAIELRRLGVSGAISKLVGDTMSDALVLAGHDRRILLWNNAAERIFGWSAVEAVGKPVTEIIAEPDCPKFDDACRRLGAEGSRASFAQPIELNARNREGERIPVCVTLGQWEVAGLDNPSGVAALITDISDRKRIETDYAHTQSFLDVMLENLPSMLFVKDVETRRYVRVNTPAARAAGVEAEEMIGKTDTELFGADQARELRKRDDQVIASRKVHIYEGEMAGRGENQLVRTQRVTFAAPNGAHYLLGISDDITRHVRAEEKAAYLANHCQVTGLRNRKAFTRYLSARIENGADFAVMRCHIGGLQRIAALHGQTTADAVLKDGATRLEQALGPDPIIARLSENDLAIAVPESGPVSNLRRLGMLVHSAIAAPGSINSGTLSLSAKVGIARRPADGSGLSKLLRATELALASAITDPDEDVRFFEASMQAEAGHRRTLERDLPRAFARGEMSLSFQPLACLESGRIAGFEALARWTHPQYGSIDPEIFVALSERNGMVMELGRETLRRATKEAACWDPPLSIAVNVSPVQLHDDGFVESVEKCLAESGLAAERLELEITEGVLLGDSEKIIDVLNALKTLGVRISIDDFGTGYSSFAYFDMFAFDKVKLDKSFVQKMRNSKHAFAVVRAVVGLGADLDIPVVGEGVEADADLELLRELGCAQAQGYLIGKPSPIETFERVVLSRDVAAGEGAGPARRMA